MLETVTDPTKTNIHYLNLEEPQGKLELPFDPNRDLTEADWVDMINRLDGHQHIPEYLDTAAHMRLLFPEKELALDKNLWDRTERQIEDGTQVFWANRDRTTIDYFAIIQAIANGLQLFPEKTSQFKYFYTDLKNAARNVGFDIFEYLDDVYMGTVSPTKREIFSNIALISQEDLNSYPKLVKYKQDLLTELQDSFEGRGMISNRLLPVVADFRLTFPDEELSIPKQIWEEWKKHFEQRKKLAQGSTSAQDWAELVSISRNLKIIVAQEIRITDHGIELIMPEPKTALSEAIPALPEVRKF
ncbi:MAG: hypothetical protein Q7R49_01830 [Candidatus Daviesbacteria bacterium]|nr:hypothetical protein [Candidatus Daviesbacteria bacterium]